MFENPLRPPKEKVIWRYLSIDKYLDLITTQTIKFTQVDIAADQLEISLMLNRLEKSGSLDGKKDILPTKQDRHVYANTPIHQNHLHCGLVF